MARKLFINREAKSRRASVVGGPTASASIDVADFVAGDKEVIQLFITDGSAIAAESGNATYSVKVALGAQNAGPSGGTFTLTFGANTTAALAYDASAAAVQSALEGLASIGSGNVTVRKTTFAYHVEFIGSKALASQAAISSNAASLTPESAVTVTELVAGSGSANEEQVIRLVRLPIAILSLTSLDAITSPYAGWEGELNLSTFRALEELNGEDSLDTILEVQLTDGDSNRSTLCAKPVRLLGEVIDETSLVPLTLVVPTVAGLTIPELQQIFVPWVPPADGSTAGKNINLLAPNGNWERELGVDNDGAAVDNLAAS